YCTLHVFSLPPLPLYTPPPPVYGKKNKFCAVLPALLHTSRAATLTSLLPNITFVSCYQLYLS
ncbi:hypothetical protein STEG23_013120, partial [Scotinomys teguina]